MINVALDFGRQREVKRIRTRLERFLPAAEAGETAMRVQDVALEIDEEISAVLEDPLVRRLYDYDGCFFTQRDTGLFHTAFDGIHLLESFSDSIIDVFFRGRKKRFAIRWLLEELDKHAWVAKRRRLNWEESRTLALLTPEVIQDLIQICGHTESGVSPMSQEEAAFFRYFEDEMRTQLSRRAA